jgi:hypothetical protein
MKSRLKDRRNTCGNLVQNSEGNNSFGRLGLDGRMILERI